MSYFDPISRIMGKRERVHYIVPERIREACSARGLSYDEAAEKCGMSKLEFGRMANGQENIPNDYIFRLMSGLNFPKDFFYYIRWERT